MTLNNPNHAFFAVMWFRKDGGAQIVGHQRSEDAWDHVAYLREHDPEVEPGTITLYQQVDGCAARLDEGA